MAHKKINVSLPEGVVSDLDYVSGRMKITRSSLMANLLSEPVGDMRNLFLSLPENPTEEDILRSRGASVDLISKRFESLRRLEANDDLFQK